MHMADAMLSPAAGGIMWAVTAALEAYSVNSLKREDIFENKKIPMMGVAGAFIFAAQMINFTIPGTGSSGHLGGGLLLAVLLGPSAGFIVLSVVLAIQALIFADGGLLALGCNIFNMGFFTCYIAYPLIANPILSKSRSRKSIFTASLLASITGLALGAFAVVLETSASGITELPFAVFASLMLPVHIAIGAVEGIVTALVLVFVNSAEPALLENRKPARGLKIVLAGFAAAAILCAGWFYQFASPNPDGLEWSVMKATATELEGSGAVHKALASVQEKTGVFPDYELRNNVEQTGVINPSGSLAGLAGSGLVLITAAGLFTFAKKLKKG